MAGALWTGYLIIKPLCSYDIGHFPEQEDKKEAGILIVAENGDQYRSATIDELSDFPNDVDSFLVYKMVANKGELLNGLFSKEEELSSDESEGGYNNTSNIFIDPENKVVISVYQDLFYCPSAKVRLDKANCTTWVSSIHDDDNGPENEPGWARSVGLNQGDPVLFVGDICVIGMSRDDVSRLLTEKPDVSVCFLKLDDWGPAAPAI